MGKVGEMEKEKEVWSGLSGEKYRSGENGKVWF